MLAAVAQLALAPRRPGMAATAPGGSSPVTAAALEGLRRQATRGLPAVVASTQTRGRRGTDSTLAMPGTAARPARAAPRVAVAGAAGGGSSVTATVEQEALRSLATPAPRTAALWALRERLSSTMVDRGMRAMVARARAVALLAALEEATRSADGFCGVFYSEFICTA